MLLGETAGVRDVSLRVALETPPCPAAVHVMAKDTNKNNNLQDRISE
jgi:hypothetical protein